MGIVGMLVTANATAAFGFGNFLGLAEQIFRSATVSRRAGSVAAGGWPGTFERFVRRLWGGRPPGLTWSG